MRTGMRACGQAGIGVEAGKGRETTLQGLRTTGRWGEETTLQVETCSFDDGASAGLGAMNCAPTDGARTTSVRLAPAARAVACMVDGVWRGGAW
jgi:hypothetical protein